MQPLATLAEVKNWIPNLSTDKEDTILTALALRTSNSIMGFLQRPSLVLHSVSETRNGAGTQSMLLREWPVVSISSVTVGELAVSAAANTNSDGYFFMPWDGFLPGAPQQLSLRQRIFTRGVGNVSVGYMAGYVVQNEAQIVAAGGVTASSPDGSWASNTNVINAVTGLPMTLVTSAPAQGEYKLDTTNPGKYVFNIADNGLAVLLSYSFFPGALVQACCEWTAERYRYRARIGQKSVSVDGKETSSYDLSGITDSVKSMLMPYKRMVPV